MANQTEDRGFNTIQNSAAAKRANNQTLQKYTLFTVLALFALTIVILLVMALGGIISNLSGNNHGKPDSERVDWGTLTVTLADTQQGNLVIVNNTHAYTFPSNNDHLKEIWAAWNSYKPAVYQQSGISTYMEATALDALGVMLSDFVAAGGQNNVQIRSAYRTLEDQDGKEIQPGYSDHHTGLGCDLKYVVQVGGNNATYLLSSDPAYAWILENCHKYGFVIRYPADKVEQTGVEDYTSYFRYVGVAHATYMKENNLCMEEYVSLLHNYTDKKPLAIRAADGKYYEVYYVAVDGSATVKYPTNYAYTLSGTNEGGVVITVDRSQAITPEADTSADTAAN